MVALGGQESNGRYNAHNDWFGASGKYQILPKNWPVWAKRAGLSAQAPQTPDNQERVTRHVLIGYYDGNGHDWRKVASLWYSGKSWRHNDYAPLKNKSGPSVGVYVDSVMQRMGAT